MMSGERAWTEQWTVRQVRIGYRRPEGIETWHKANNFGLLGFVTARVSLVLACRIFMTEAIKSFEVSMNYQMLLVPFPWRRVYFLCTRYVRSFQLFTLRVEFTVKSYCECLKMSMYCKPVSWIRKYYNHSKWCSVHYSYLDKLIKPERTERQV